MKSSTRRQETKRRRCSAGRASGACPPRPRQRRSPCRSPPRAGQGCRPHAPFLSQCPRRRRPVAVATWLSHASSLVFASSSSSWALPPRSIPCHADLAQKGLALLAVQRLSERASECGRRAASRTWRKSFKSNSCTSTRCEFVMTSCG